MPDEKTTEKAETIEWTDVPIQTMPEWTGARAKCRATIASPGFYKCLFHLPIPTTDAEAEAMYGPGKTMDYFAKAGVIAESYKCKGQIKDYFAPKIQGDIDLIDLKDKPMPMSVLVKIETETKTSEAKKAKAVQEKHGVTSAEDLDAKLARLREFEEKAAKKSKK